MDDHIFGDAVQRIAHDKKLAYALALQAAIRDRDRAGVTALLTAGADVNWRNSFGEAALFVCSNYDSRNGVDMTADLIAGHGDCVIDLPDKFGLTSLRNAVLFDRPATANAIRAALGQRKAHPRGPRT